MDGLILFWGANRGAQLNFGCFSQWAKYGFTIDGISYRNAEQFMMAEKARLFHDGECLAEIMAATSPKEIKRLGRKVANFDASVWAEHRFDIVVRGNLAKFSQNVELKKFLLDTNEALIAEASPKDAVWGLGLNAEEAERISPNRWPGQNLLGKVLMEVRRRLREGEAT